VSLNVYLLGGYDTEFTDVLASYILRLSLDRPLFPSFPFGSRRPFQCDFAIRWAAGSGKGHRLGNQPSDAGRGALQRAAALKGSSRLQVSRAPGSTVVPSHGSRADLAGKNITRSSRRWAGDVESRMRFPSGVWGRCSGLRVSMLPSDHHRGLTLAADSTCQPCASAEFTFDKRQRRNRVLRRANDLWKDVARTFVTHSC